MSVIEEYRPHVITSEYGQLRGLARKAAIQLQRTGTVQPALVEKIQQVKAALDQERGRTI